MRFRVAVVEGVGKRLLASYRRPWRLREGGERSAVPECGAVSHGERPAVVAILGAGTARRGGARRSPVATVTGVQIGFFAPHVGPSSRDGIAAATGREPEEVQDEYANGTRTERLA